MVRTGKTPLCDLVEVISGHLVGEIPVPDVRSIHAYTPYHDLYTASGLTLAKITSTRRIAWLLRPTTLAIWTIWIWRSRGAFGFDVHNEDGRWPFLM